MAMGDTGTGPRDAGMLRRDAEVVPGDAGMIPQGASIPWGLLSQHPGHPRDGSHLAFWQPPAGSRCCTCTQGRLLDVEPWPLQQLRARAPRAAHPAGPFPAPKSFGWVEEKGWAGIRPQHRVSGCKKSPKTSPLGSFRLPSGRAFCISGLSPPPRVGLGVSDTPGGGMQGLLHGRGLGFDNKGKTRAGRGAGDGALQDALRDPNPFSTRASVSSRARLPEKIRLFPARPPGAGPGELKAAPGAHALPSPEPQPAPGRGNNSRYCVPAAPRERPAAAAGGRQEFRRDKWTLYPLAGLLGRFFHRKCRNQGVRLPRRFSHPAL